MIEKYIRHPLEAAGLVVVWTVFRMLSVDRASALGGWLGRGIGPHLPVSKRARNNLRRVMPELSEAEIKKIVVDMWDNLARTAAEFPHIRKFKFGPGERVEVTGIENIKSLAESSRPVMFYSGHIGNWELAPLTAARNGLETAFVYREANNRLVQKLYMRGRRGLTHGLIRKGAKGAREMIKVLREGRPVGMLIDQKMNDGIAVPFFGEDAMTAPALAHMAMRFDCQVIGARVIRLNGARFRVEIYPPKHVAKSGDKDADALAFLTDVNREIEGWIRERPGQWLWLHNRWPSRD